MALPKPTTSTPVAIGSSVPAWPTRFMCRAPRTAATTSWLVTPCGLSMTSRPELSGFVVIVPILDLDIVIIVEVVIIGLVVLVRIGVAGVLRVGAGLGEFFVALVCEREDVLDLMGLARHFVEDEFQLRGESQSGLGAYQGTQASFGLVQGLLRAAAFALLVSFVAELVQ